MLSSRARRARRGWLPLALLLVVSSLLVVSVPAAADEPEEPVFVGWSAVLPALARDHDPTSSDECVAGRTTCVSKVIREMDADFDPLAASCDHRAVFALAYLRTTEMYLRTSETPGFYADPRYVNHEDVVFAELYFDAVAAWESGDRERVPPAWRTALDAAAGRRVTGSGDLLLGINAHVNQDLPFALEAVGLVDAQGGSRKRDHDQINQMLNMVVEPMVAEAAARFDPGIAAVPTPYGIGHTALLQLVVSWREAAWRAAEDLERAPDAAARAEVVARIEATADAQAQAIVTATSYNPPLTSTAARDAYCAERASS